MHTKQLAAQLQRIRRRISDCTLPKNKEMKKTNLLVLLLLLLSLLLCLSALLAACTPDGEKPDDTGSKTPEVKLSVVSGGATGYKIIFGANAADAESKAALRLQRAFKDKLGAEIELSIDSIIPAAGYVESDKEIVVGSTNRTLDEAEAGTPFRTSDYKIGISGEKIYIIGGSPEATSAAVDTFISDILKSDTEGSFCFSSASAVVYRAEYRITSFTADGAELSDYTVLLSNRLPELILSKIDSLTAKIGSLYGIAPGKAYETDGKAFLIGTTDIYPEYASLMGDASSLFTVSDGKVLLMAESNYHLMKAIDQIMNDLEATEGAYTLSTGKNNCILEESSTLSSMSFNLYGTTDIEQRRGAVGTIIMNYLHTKTSLLSVPVTNSKDDDRTGHIIEDMAYHSWKVIRPQYFEVLFDGIIARDSETTQMLDIIYDNVFLDLVQPLGGVGLTINNAIRGLIDTNSKSIASTWKSNMSQNQKILEQVIKKYETLP